MNEWSPWVKNDPGQKEIISGTPSAVGHKQEWDGKINGKGMQEIPLSKTKRLFQS